MLSVMRMLQRFRHALSEAHKNDGFGPIAGAGLLLVMLGTFVYWTSQGWSLVNAFYFAVATLTTSSIADPSLTIEGAWIKLFTVLYIIIGIGILVELARQIGMGFVEVNRQEREARHARHASRHGDPPGDPDPSGRA